MMKLYRYEAWRTAYDRFQRLVKLEEYLVEKETPQGYWIHCGDRKWVSKEGRNIYARTTKERALEDFICRKKHHILILEANLSFAKTALAEAKLMKK